MIHSIAIAFCVEEFNGGLIWPKTLSNSQASLACRNAGTHFEAHTITTRYCDINGNWSDLDLSTCTLVEKSITFLHVWFMLEDNEPALGEINLTYFVREIYDVHAFKILHRFVFTDAISS